MRYMFITPKMVLFQFRMNYLMNQNLIIRFLSLHGLYPINPILLLSYFHNP